MAGRPSLRIGEHGKITRTRIGNGSWLARCRYRDRDGVTRIGADHLGHTNVSMTQDRYLSRGRVHTQVADLLDRLVCEPDDRRKG